MQFALCVTDVYAHVQKSSYINLVSLYVVVKVEMTKVWK